MAAWVGQNGERKFPLALTPEMHQQIAIAAAVGKVSMNEWIRNQVEKGLAGK